MLTNLTPQPADKILALMQMFREDPREQKIDLGVGVYKNAEGVTPVMRAVKAAEHKLVETQETKAYTGLAGDPAFSTAMRGLILGDTVDASRVAAVATPGGTGAIRACTPERTSAPGLWIFPTPRTGRRTSHDSTGLTCGS